MQTALLHTRTQCFVWHCWIHIECLEYYRASSDFSQHKDKINKRHFCSPGKMMASKPRYLGTQMVTAVTNLLVFLL
jgi:hypothetical protein